LYFLLLLRYDILRQFSEEIIKRLIIDYSIKFSSCLGSELLKQGKIDVRSDICIPCITAYEIIFLTDSQHKDRDFHFLIIRNHLDRIKSHIRITIRDQYDYTRFIRFLDGKFLKIDDTEQECITDSRSEKLLDRREITKIHRL